MFSKKPNGRVSLLIVENIRKDGKVKQKTVCGLGHFSADDIRSIESYKKIGEELIVKIKNERSPALPGMEKIVHGKTSQICEKKNKNTVDVTKLKEESREVVGHQQIFGSLFDELGFNDSIDHGYKKKQANELLKKIVLEPICHHVLN